jgi:uncharacterized membrane protein YhaH (DUF805 family)
MAKARLQFFWGACAIIGLVAVVYPSVHVGGMDTMIADLTHGWGGIAIALDLLFVAIPVVAFMVIEARRLGMRWPWIWVPLIIPLPGAFVIPVFFLLRERALLRIRAGENSPGGNA